jgi:hypothetical protein
MNALDQVMLRSVQQAQESSVTLLFGRIKVAGTRTVTVTLNGVDVPKVPVMKSYNAAVGDWAWLLRQGTLLIAIGCTNGAVNDELKGSPNA